MKLFDEYCLNRALCSERANEWMKVRMDIVRWKWGCR